LRRRVAIGFFFRAAFRRTLAEDFLLRLLHFHVRLIWPRGNRVTGPSPFSLRFLFVLEFPPILKVWRRRLGHHLFRFLMSLMRVSDFFSFFFVSSSLPCSFSPIHTKRDFGHLCHLPSRILPLAVWFPPDSLPLISSPCSKPAIVVGKEIFLVDIQRSWFCAFFSIFFETTVSFPRFFFSQRRRLHSYVIRER